MDPETRPSHHVQSLVRGLSVITAFGPERPEMTLSEVARATGLTRAGARRFLLTLVDLGYVHTDGKLFRLAPRVLELGYAYLSSMSLPAIAEPHLEGLVAHTNESSSVSVLDGSDIVYVARVPTSRIMTVAISVGTRFPAYATSMGRVLLADLSEEELRTYLDQTPLQPLTKRTVTDRESLRGDLATIRQDGYALVDQELELGLRSMAAPIRDKSGRVVAAVNVSSQVSRVTKAQLREHLGPLLKTAAAIETDLSRT